MAVSHTHMYKPKPKKFKKEKILKAVKITIPKKNSKRNMFPTQRAPSAFNTVTETVKAQFRPGSSKDSICVIHKELVGTYSAAATQPGFSVGASIPVNPGILSSFPWLAIMAAAWEKYKFKRIRVHFISRLGTNVNGQVIIAPDYDASDSAPGTEQSITSKMGSKESSQWNSFYIDLDPKLLNRECFIRNANLAANQDIKLYDIANIYVADVGTSSAANTGLGTIWFEYEVELIQPDSQLVTVPNPYATFVAIVPTNITTATPFGTSLADWNVYSGYFPVTSGFSNTFSVSNLTNGLYYKVYYCLTIRQSSSAAHSNSTSNQQYGLQILSGGTAYENKGEVPANAGIISTAFSQAMYCHAAVYFKASGSSASFGTGNNVFAGTVQGAIIEVFQVSGGYVLDPSNN